MKSQLVQFILTFLFGPLGLFYSSIAAALFWIVMAVIVGGSTVGVGLLVIWPLIMITGFFTVSGYNERLRILAGKEYLIGGLMVGGWELLMFLLVTHFVAN